jgi:TonB family protein
MQRKMCDSAKQAIKISGFFLIFFCGLAFATQDAHAQKGVKKVNVSSDLMRSLVTQKVDPDYPAKAVAARIEGPVVLSVTVDQDGSVLEAGPVKCGQAMLEQAAIAAVKKWHYNQPAVHGQPVEVQGDVTVDFVLPPASGGTQRMRVGTEAAESHIASQVAPMYPGAAKRGRIQGCVVVHAEINKDGKVEHAKTVSGDPLLRESAQSAVSQYRFKPFEQNGEATDVDTYVIVKFHIP